MKTAMGILALLYAAAALAQPQQSENFRITKSVLDAGGGASSSANFHLVSAFGQPTPIGVSSSANFALSAGFLSPTFAASPLSPIADLVVKRQPGLSSDVKLDWSAVPGATSYTIYRNTNPLFTPVPGDTIGTSATNTFTDANALNLPLARYYYIVTSISSGGPMARVPEDPARAAPGEKRKRNTIR